MDQTQRYDNRTAGILLITASLILMANGALNIYRFSIEYGIAAGAIGQSYATNVTVAAILRPAVDQITTIYQTILEAALASGIGFIMFAMSLILLLRGPNSYESYLKRYVPLHLMLTVIYLVIIMMMSVAFSSVIDNFALYMSYLSIAICIALDIYIEYSSRMPQQVRRFGRGISINPFTPYSNLVKLKEALFDTLSGEVCIVDKHFNSAAMANLYRLMPVDGKKIRSLSILTSEDMLDSKFGGNYQDLKSELGNAGISVEIRIMKKEDALVQHERFIFDDNVSYKIPPLSIINKKSEHIVRMGLRDAKSRFDYLSHNAIKFENYAEKHGREAAQG